MTAHCDNEVIVNSYVGIPQANLFKALIFEVTQIKHQIVLFIKIQWNIKPKAGQMLPLWNDQWIVCSKFIYRYSVLCNMLVSHVQNVSLMSRFSSFKAWSGILACAFFTSSFRDCYTPMFETQSGNIHAHIFAQIGTSALTKNIEVKKPRKSGVRWWEVKERNGKNNFLLIYCGFNFTLSPVHSPLFQNSYFLNH